jgi:signal recognition particle receptor subunit beta
LAGKRTNIEQARQKLPVATEAAPADPQGLIVVAAVLDEKLFAKKLLLNTVADPPASAAVDLWTIVLRGAHGIIFVADSELARHDQNISAMSDVIARLSSFRTKIEQFPFVIQYNKRDIESPIPILKFEDELNPFGLPAFNAVARDGHGVLECLRAINRLIENFSHQHLITLG